MPRIIDYEVVLDRMQREGFRCVYFNSGAFEFVDANVKTLGWIGPDDPTIREEAKPLLVRVPPPYEANLAEKLVRAWKEILPGEVWVMPLSHWSYELDFGSREWMPAALEEIGIDAKILEPRTNAAAIEFSLEEEVSLKAFAAQLLANLKSSDFALAFPGRSTLCTLHHHKQLWWRTTADNIQRDLDAIIRSG